MNKMNMRKIKDATEQIIEYFRDVRIKCSCCLRRFISSQSLRNHIEFFHKMYSVFDRH